MNADYVTKQYLDERLTVMDKGWDKKFTEKFSEQSAEIKRHNEALAESFRHDVMAMTEQLTTRTHVREIIKEEVDERLNDHSERIATLEETVLL